MTQDIAKALQAAHAQLAEQNRRLAEVVSGLESLPAGVQIALDDVWTEDFERATEMRSEPSPVSWLHLIPA